MDVKANALKESQRRGFTIHQKVVLELDFSGSLWGYTELTILPNTPDLRTIHLHSRQCTVHNVTVAAKPAEFTFLDPIANIPLDADARDIHKQKELKRKLYTAMSESDEGELSIAIPADVPLRPGPNGEVEVVNVSSGLDYLPLAVNVTYSLHNPADGVEFVKPSEAYPYRVPHVYTTPSSPDAARCWVPCVDNAWEKCTWEFEFIVPRYLEERSSSQDDDQGDALPTLVVCSGELVEQVAHPNNSNKSIFLFSQASPTTVQHIAFAAGPFHLHPIPFDHAHDDTPAGSQQTLMYAFCLPGQERQLSISTSNLRQAMSFYTSEFGSYPYSSYKLVFVDELCVQRFDSATLSLVSVDMLHGDDAIEQTFETRHALSHALACQWVGMNIQPKMWSDIWLINALSAYMTGLFLRKIMGNNEYRFRLRKDMDRVCELDSGSMPPMCQPTLLEPPGAEVLPFINLKGPLVLHILDRKLGKSGTALGLSRVIPKIYLTAISGELQNNLLSTHHFIRTCRKVSGVDLRVFAEQWIYGSGCPSFSFNASFNRKKMAVEINMSQWCEAWTRNHNDETRKLAYKPVEVFEGTMTVRIHEADGTPYEHVLDIRSSQKRYEVPFNTKYKRVRRNTKRYLARQAAAQAAAEGDAEAAEAIGMIDMGFGLEIWEREDERSNWKVADWTEEDENTMSGATYEWIRMDADFEWITDLTFEQPDFMWVSQLQRDRDVVAQMEALNALARQPTAIVSSTLTRTVLVTNYFFRIRCAAATALVSCAIRKLDFLGLFHLFKLFLRYCYEPEDPAQDLFAHSYVPKPNNFSDIPEYFVRKSLINTISRVRFENGRAPGVVRQFLIDQLRYNDNTSNPYSDGFYICTIIAAASGAVVCTNPPEHGELMPTEGGAQINAEDNDLLKQTISEVERYRNMDRLIPSPHNVVTVACLEFFIAMDLAHLVPPPVKIFFPLTREGNYNQVRMAAFDGLFLTDWYKPQIARYILTVMAVDSSRDIRRHVARNAVQSLALLFHMGEFKANMKDQGSLLIEEDGSKPELAKEQKKTEVDLMIRAFRKDKQVGKNDVFRDLIMPIAMAPEVDNEVRWCILKLADLIVKANDEEPVSMKIVVPATPATEISPWDELENLVSSPTVTTPKTTISIKPTLKIPAKVRSEPSRAASPASVVSSPVVSAPKVKFKPTKPAPPPPPKPKETPKAMSGGMSEPDLKACRASLKSLQTNPRSLWFRTPVDPVRDQAPNYFDVIKKPMDLSTVQQKLQSGRYRNRDAFRTDVLLMISNAKQYNAPGSVVHEAALALDRIFEKQWSKINNTLAAHTQSVTTQPVLVPTDTPPSSTPSTGQKLKISLGRPAASSNGKAQPRMIKGPGTEPTHNPSGQEQPDAGYFPPPPPYIDDGSHDLLQEVLAVEEAKEREKKKHQKSTSESHKTTNGSSSSKRKVSDMVDDEDEELLSLATTSKRSRQSPPDHPRAPAPPQTARVIVPGPTQRASSFTPTPSHPVTAKGKERAAPSSTLNGPGTPIHEKNCRDLLRTLQNDPVSLIFRRPVDPIADGCPTYYDEIQLPMDLSTMSKKLANRQYDTMESFKSDLDLIVANCRQFNPPFTYPTDQAALLEKLVDKEWPKALTFKLSAVEKKRLATIMSELSALPHIGFIFALPVDPVLLQIPTYYDMIPKEQTRDLQTIRQKILNDEYATVDDVEADLLLMVNNAITFNGAQSEVGASAYAMQKAYRSALDNFRMGSKKRKDNERGGSQPSKKLKIG